MLLARDQLTTSTFLNWRAKKHLHGFVVVNGEFTKTLKKVDILSRDSCLIYGINFKLSGQGSFFNMTTTPGIKENLTH